VHGTVQQMLALISVAVAMCAYNNNILYGDTFHPVTQTLLFVIGVTGCLAEERQWSLVVKFAQQQKESC